MVTIAVTGVTGYAGSRVAAGLEKRGIEVRYLPRDPAKAGSFPADRTYVAEYGDAEAARRALAGVDLLFMVSAVESDDRQEQQHTFIDAAASAGVGHVVYTSFLGASPEATFTFARTHFATEEHIKASGMAWTFLRDSFYLDLLPQFAGQDGVIRGPGGNGRVGAVVRDDVARSAVAVLADEHSGRRSHAGQAYDLTGPESLTLAEIAQIVTEETGRDVTYYDETLEEARASRAAYDPSEWMMQAWLSTYTAIAAGELDVVSSAVADLTGRSATALREHVRAQG